MKLVAENLNEAIKHLSPKSEQEIEKSLDTFSVDELITYGVKNNAPKYVLQALKSNKEIDKWSKDYQAVYQLFLKSNFTEGIEFLCQQDNKNVERFLEASAMNNIDLDKWSKKLIPLLKYDNKGWSIHGNSELYRVLTYAEYYNYPETIKLLLKHNVCTQRELAELVIDNYNTKWGATYQELAKSFPDQHKKKVEKAIEIIKLAFTNLKVDDIPTSTYKNHDFVGDGKHNIQKEYTHIPHKKKLKIIIKLMKLAKMDEKLIKPFTDKLYNDATTITVERLINLLKKYNANDNVVVNFDDDGSSLSSSNDYEQIVSMSIIKDESGDILNIKTTKFKY